MTISYSWLKDYLQCDLNAAQIAEALTSIGLEVDSVETTEAIPGGLQGVVVAKVLECEPHPDSDHLHVTKVDAGTGEPLQVVCGAPNVAKGQKVLLATIGTVLGPDFKIKKGRIRGVDSYGMLCAEDELGIGTNHDGIMVLEADAVVGTPAKEYLKLQDETVIEIGLTANRVDAASHLGVARDLYAYLKYNGIPCKFTVPDVSDMDTAFASSAKGPVSVSVSAPDGCPKYSGITMTDVKVGPSPEWMAKRLQSIGLRPINNVVDISNFVLMESGQPLHTFDADKIGGGKINVRWAAQDEIIKTLDGVERKLSAKDLVIADDKRPMCIAGVFGGEDSGTTENTKNVFIESAYFAPASIRKTSKRHTLKTDASFRYERGADPLATEWAAKRAASLMAQLCGAKAVGGYQKCCGADIAKKEVELDFARIENFIGKKIGADTIVRILECLQYEFVSKTATGAVVKVPSYMIDVYRECDIVEEILRIYGYNNVELPASIHSSVNPSQHPEPEAVRNMLSDFLAANGFNEIMNNSLTRSEYYTGLSTLPESACVRIMNPLSNDLNVMRQSLLPGALETVAYNLRRQCSSMKLFEYGSIYSLVEGVSMPDKLDKIKEKGAFCLTLTGAADKSWNFEPAKGSFFALKGYIELMLKRIGSDIYQLETAAAPSDLFAEGVTYSLPGSGEILAVMGTVLPSFAKRFGVKQPVFSAEIYWPVLMKLVKRNKVKYSELPKFPEVRRDLALLLDENVSYADMRKAAIKAGKKMIKAVGLFDVYRGDKIPAGKKQYAMSFILQDLEKTLTDMDVERIMANVLGVFEKDFGAQIR